MKFDRRMLAGISALLLAGGVSASTGAFDFELSAAPEPRCENAKALETTCPIMRLLKTWFTVAEKAPDGGPRPSAVAEPERAALQWAHDRWAPTDYQVRVTRVEESSGPIGQYPPREVTMAVYDRAETLVTRVRVFVTAKGPDWTVQQP